MGCGANSAQHVEGSEDAYSLPRVRPSPGAASSSIARHCRASLSLSGYGFRPTDWTSLASLQHLWGPVAAQSGAACADSAERKSATGERRGQRGGKPSQGGQDRSKKTPLLSRQMAPRPAKVNLWGADFLPRPINMFRQVPLPPREMGPPFCCAPMAGGWQRAGAAMWWFWGGDCAGVCVCGGVCAIHRGSAGFPRWTPCRRFLSPVMCTYRVGANMWCCGEDPSPCVGCPWACTMALLNKTEL